MSKPRVNAVATALAVVLGAVGLIAVGFFLLVTVATQTLGSSK